MKILLILLFPTLLFAQNVTELPKYEIRQIKDETDTLKVRENFKDLYANKQNASTAMTTDTDQTITGAKTFSDFTALGSGNVAIKIKKITGTTSDTEGGTTSVAHGLTGSKIIGWTLKVEYGTNSGDTVGDLSAGYKFQCAHDATNFNITLDATSSENVLLKPFIVLIFYEE